MDAADFQAAGLYEPRARRAAERLALLEWLAGRGVTLEQMVRAHREGSLMGIAGDLALRSGPQFALAEVAERARFEPAGKRLLKGFDEPVTLFAVERA